LRGQKIRDEPVSWLTGLSIFNNPAVVSTTSSIQPAFRKFYGRCEDLDCHYNLLKDQMLSDVFLANSWTVLDTLILTTDYFINLI
jgi:hypothetical protein